MVFIQAKDYDDIGRRASSILISQVILNKKSVLGLATGSSPISTYQHMIKANASGLADFREVKTVNLDEYVGLDPAHNQSYFYFMNENLFKHINIDIAQTRVPSGISKDFAKECVDYENHIKSVGGVDIQLLGLGHNGHIGFNEPAEDFPVTTHCVDLTESTISANERFFEKREDVPTKAITMGIGTIMKARKIVLVVNGEAKADIVEKAFFGPVTPNIPASVLQLHPDVVIIGDAQAFSKIQNRI